MRNPGEVAETQNLTRPRVGLIIGINGTTTNSNNINLNNNNNNISTNNNNYNENQRTNNKFDFRKLKVSKQPSLEISSLKKMFGKKIYIDTFSQTSESSFKKSNITISNDIEFTIINYLENNNKGKSINNVSDNNTKNNNNNNNNSITKNEKIHKFYSSGCKTKKNDIQKPLCENENVNLNVNVNENETDLKVQSSSNSPTKLNNENGTSNNKSEMINDFENSSSKFSLLKKISEKNLFNVKVESSQNPLRESKTEFRQTKSISKPFSTNQFKINDTGKSPIIVKDSIRPSLNPNLRSSNSNTNLEKNSNKSKEPNKFRRVSHKK